MLALLLLVAQPSSTTCYRVGTNVQCDTYQQQPSPGINWGLAPRPFNAMESIQAFQMGQQMRQQEELNRQQEELYRRQQAMAAARSNPRYPLASEVSRLIGEGKCREAYTVAFLAGDGEMADRARGMCPF